jgi:hypothetical protein
MVLQLIKIKLDMENIESFSIPEDHAWKLDVRLTSTNDVRMGVDLSAVDEVEIPNSRGMANLVLRVDKNDYATLKIQPLPKIIKSSISATDCEKSDFVPVLAVECRGCEIQSWTPTGYYQVTTRSGSVFDEVDLSQGEWYEVDAETSEPVSIVSFSSKIDVHRGDR